VFTAGRSLEGFAAPRWRRRRHAARLSTCTRTSPQDGGAAFEAVPGSRTLQILKATARQPAAAFLVRTVRRRA